MNLKAGYSRFEESSRWIAEVTGGAAEAGPVGPRDASGEDAQHAGWAVRRGRANCPARGSGAEAKDTVNLIQGKSTKV